MNDFFLFSGWAVYCSRTYRASALMTFHAVPLYSLLAMLLLLCHVWPAGGDVTPLFSEGFMRFDLNRHGTEMLS